MSRLQANDAARRIIARLSMQPDAGEFLKSIPGGFRVIPEEVWIDKFGQWIRLDDMRIKQGGHHDLCPGPIMRWKLRRLFRWWRTQVHVPDECGHVNQTNTVWTQDGYTSWCRTCKRVLYHGD